jgi:hypothetical protein
MEATILASGTYMLVATFVCGARHVEGATFSNPFVRFGNGLTFEVNYSRYLITSPLFSLSGEVPVVFNLDEDVNSGANVVP